jgi:hypothetical protein
MDRKVLAILLIILTATCLVMGCAGRRNEATPTPMPTTAPAATASIGTAAGSAVQASAVPGQATATPVPTAVPSGTVSGSSGSGIAGLNPSLLDISGEGQDEGGMPDDGLPTPTVN